MDCGDVLAEGSETSEVESRKGLSEVWDEGQAKGGNNVLLRQMRQMKCTIKTLMEINQDQHWKILELSDEKSYLTRQVRELTRQLQLVETQVGRQLQDPGKGSEDPYDLVKISPLHARPFIPAALASKQPQYRRVPEPKKTEPKVTERIQELLDSSTTSNRPIVVPFTFDNFGSGVEEKDKDKDKEESKGSEGEKVGSDGRQAQYQALAELFVNTAVAGDKPQGPQPTMPLIKRLEHSLREGIGTNDQHLLAETILQVKEKKMATLIDLAPAERKLNELLTATTAPMAKVCAQIPVSSLNVNA